MLLTAIQRLWQTAFDCDGSVRVWLIAAFVLVNSLVLLNAVQHETRIAYDAGQHLRYVDVLAGGRLPRRTETAAFYNPPLPYIVPALVRWSTGSALTTAARLALLVQWTVSVALTLALLVACQRLRARDGTFKLVALGLCTAPAVYYRTFAMMRGEPYLAMLGMVVTVLLLGALADNRFDLRRALLFGLACAAIALTRQLGALLLIGSLAFLVLEAVRRKPGSLLALVVSGAMVVIASGWFYAGLRVREGSSLAWNVPRATFSLGNQPAEFYFGLGSGELFSHPGRPRYQKQFLPVLLSDWWGDYWHYFLFRGKRADGACAAWPAPAEPNAMPQTTDGFDGNYQQMLRYLGWLNLTALLPSALLAAGFVVGAIDLGRVLRGPDRDVRAHGIAFIFCLAATSLAGYAWFVISYPRPGDGDTVKATYVFQVVPLIAILGAEALARLRERSAASFRAVAALLVVISLACIPATLSRWRGRLDCGLPTYERRMKSALHENLAVRDDRSAQVVAESATKGRHDP